MVVHQIVREADSTYDPFMLATAQADACGSDEVIDTGCDLLVVEGP